MPTYYFRAKSLDTLRQLGIDLGLLKLYPGSKQPDGSTTPDRVDVARPGKDMWIEIGAIYRPTGKMLDTPMGQVPETAPVIDASGNVLQHANLMLHNTVRVDPILGEMKAELMTSIAVEAIKTATPEAAARIQAAMTDQDSVFISDETGKARDPSSPVHVFV